ncbi:DUF7344 domain-containing protein [Haloglomus litoreum]|uniref:DUF7344 domain-containing protein n=1 Tax=Haloglomus litoreum TaxID=3034026 RepID=UPI0023E82BD0|nr:hypothetical protein [Haloglomus sp. DT116]
MGGNLSEHRDELFDLLSNSRRRYAWHYLKSCEGREAIPLGEVAEQVAAWENDKRVGELDTAERKRVYTSLQQQHLPRMDRADIVDFEDNEIRLADRADEFDVYIDIVDDDDIPWSEYYLGLGAVCAALITAVWVTGIRLPFVSGLGWAAIVVLAFVGSAAVHVYIDHRRKLGQYEEPPGVRSSRETANAVPADD